MLKSKKFNVVLTLTEPMLGTAPSNLTVYQDHIATKKNRDLLKGAVAAGDTAKIAAITKEDIELAAEEAATLPEDDKGITVFRTEKGSLFLYDYMIRGFLKAAAEAVSDVWGINSKIDKWLFVFPRIIPILRDGKPIEKADSKLERPLRAQTMQGPRVTLSCSEMLNEGCTLEFQVEVLDKGLSNKALGKDKGGITSDLLKDWFEYGRFSGLGQWRNGSYGRFTAKITELK